MKTTQTEQVSLDGMISDVVHIVREYEKTGTNRWTQQTALIDLQYQLGSLSKLYLQLKGDRYAHGKTATEIRSSIADELTDIVACTLFISAEMNIDLPSAWKKMLQSDNDKIARRQHPETETLDRKVS